MGESKSRMVGGHRVISKIGSGGMGTVYRAEHTRLGKTVALKVLPPQFAEDEKVRLRFEREARSLAQMSHPNIVRAYDFGQDGNFIFISMELVEGQSLLERIEEGGPIPEKEALDLVRQIACGLGHAEEKGMIHRDIKPGNILLTTDGVAKITDFGIVKPTAGDSRLQTTIGIALGTPDFMSPEQAIADERIDTRSDLYSLGATLYNMLTARLPFEGRNDLEIINQHLTGSIPDPRRVVPSLAESTAQIVRRLMAKKPRERYQKPAELVFDIERALAGQPLSRPPVSRPNRRRGASPGSGSGVGRKVASRPTWVPVVGASLLVALLILPLVWVLGGGSSDGSGSEVLPPPPPPPLDPTELALEEIRIRELTDVASIRDALTDLRAMLPGLAGGPLETRGASLEIVLRARLREVQRERADAVLRQAKDLADRGRLREAIEVLEGAVIEIGDPALMARFNRRILEYRRRAESEGR